MKIITPLNTLVIIISCVFLIAFFIIIFPWLIMFFGLSTSPNPLIPEITYGEFPFRLEYEINGEKKIVEDTLICEYDGVGMDEGRGKFLKWKQYLASGNKELLLLENTGMEGIAFSNKKTTILTIYYDPGPAWFYMGDNHGARYTFDFPNASYSEKYNDGSGSNGIMSKEDLLSKYDIKLINWDYAKPIENKFK